ncbi:MAG TPA: CHC2 zinc finger domain-containing protein [Gemmataceae bacterium]|nr:CHC2 zinc finger domain-containing protein [Gemmataceae bacterium]
MLTANTNHTQPPSTTNPNNHPVRIDTSRCGHVVVTAPLYRGDGRDRTFSVNLEENVFHCFASCCGQAGDVIDLWAQLQQMTLRAAALDLVQTFGVEAALATEKRHG